VDDFDFIITGRTGIVFGFCSASGFINCGQFPMLTALTETIIPSLLVSDLLTPQQNRCEKPKADTESRTTDFIFRSCSAGDKHQSRRDSEKADATEDKPEHFIYLFSYFLI
jgi:hypothetical protein